MLPDSAKLQEEEAAYANRKGYSKHHPALPLYTAEDAAATLERLEPIALGEAHEVSPHLTVTLTRAGHILGSACVAVDVRRRGRHTRILYSGDLGRYDAPVLRDPVPVHEADLLLVESTYGDRLHDGGDTSAHLERVVNEVVAQKGCLLIPSFAVGRTQDVLYLLGQLEDQKRIPVLPVYVDSPMATDVTEVYMRHAEDFDAEAKAVQGRSPLRTRRTQFVATPRESKALNGHPGPLIIISASGMATGGRVLHHLQHRLPEPRTTVLLVGYQAAGTRGRRLLEGAEEAQDVRRDGAGARPRAGARRPLGARRLQRHPSLARGLRARPAPDLHGPRRARRRGRHGGASEGALRLEDRGRRLRRPRGAVVPGHGDSASKVACPHPYRVRRQAAPSRRTAPSDSSLRRWALTDMAAAKCSASGTSA